MSKPFYTLDDDTLQLLLHALDMAHTFADFQISEEARDDMYTILEELNSRFNLPDFIEIQETIAPVKKTDGVVPFDRRARPDFGVIKGGKDKDKE